MRVMDSKSLKTFNILCRSFNGFSLFYFHSLPFTAMDDNKKRMLISMLPAVIQPPPHHFDDIRNILLIFHLLSSMVWSPDTDIRFRLFGGDHNVYPGRDVFSFMALNRFTFHQVTGETPESFIELERTLTVPLERGHKLSLRNRILLFMIWARSYPTYFLLSSMFGVSKSTVENEISELIPILFTNMKSYIKWPTFNEWQAFRGKWHKIPDAVGAIDGTSHEIYRPLTEPQEQFYSGNRAYHCLHTQVVVDANGVIRYIESGFMGHLNDAQTFSLMRQIGAELEFPNNCVLLGDKIYPNGDHIMTPYTAPQLARKDAAMRRKCRKLNNHISHYRVSVEHAIAELKLYKAVSSVWRHPRPLLSQMVTICAGLMCRKRLLELHL